MAEKNLNLPKDLVLEILPRLPVKSLVRFKCVAKSWKTLFATPSFVSKQLSVSSIKHKNNPLLMVSRVEHLSNCFELHSNGNPSPNLHKPFDERYVCHMYGPCNGIFCVHSRLIDLILWNPATREVKLPPPPLIPPSDEHTMPVYGFGIDPKTNDYKVVKLLFGPYSEGRHRPAIAEVYNLTTDSWRIINDIVPACYIYHPHYDSYVNGVHCWVADNESDKIILCFDMSTETFHEIKVPLAGISSNDFYVYMGDGIIVINNCISYFCLYENYYRSLFEIAVMDKYNGAESSWTKSSFMLDNEKKPERLENFHIGIRGCWKDDEIILSVQPQQEFLTSYKIDGSELRPVQDILVKSRKLYWLREYIESIVPLTM